MSLPLQSGTTLERLPLRGVTGDQALLYQTGFAQHFETEALSGALPLHNSPQRCPYGLYAEQLSATAFTAPRANNRRSWLYRMRPSAAHGAFRQIENRGFVSDFSVAPAPPDPLRWSPLSYPTTPTDFVEGLVTFAGTGDPHEQIGCAILLYAATSSMVDRAFYDADAELLIVPQEGRVLLVTELGLIALEPQEVAIIPRGVRFRVQLLDGHARGYVCENFGAPFRLPDLGPIGANGLACERDFRTPTAWFEEQKCDWELLARLGGQLWSAPMDNSPFDVVAWRGNCAPCKYDLRRFNAIGSVSYDHPDPSIFLVLQSITDTPGVSNVDFVIFPPRWLVMQDTFRPPWYHRNIASEFMGLIHGAYDAKAEGFVPGGASLHNCMSGHGPDAPTFECAVRADTSRPVHIVDTMAFMFETRCLLRPSRAALDSPSLQRDYALGWQKLNSRFDPGQR